MDDQNQANTADKAGRDKACVHPEGRDTTASGAEVEKDHRGVILPTRHRAGGIITPQ
jgi:hypothetical protein